MSRFRETGRFAASALAAALIASAVTAQMRPASAAGVDEAAGTMQGAPAQSAKLGLGRAATPEEIAGWDIDVRPDGQGLPVGRGTAKQGEALYLERCATCHGEFGESAGRWPILSGGAGTLTSHDPMKSIGSFWPYPSTVIDYIRRAMPFGNPQSLTNDELYAVTAYVLFLNDVIADDAFELNATTFKTLRLANQPNFIDDDREAAEKELWKKQPCMQDCLPGEAKVTGRARALDVTPEQQKKGARVE